MARPRDAAELRSALSRMEIDLDVLRRLIGALIAAGILDDPAYEALWDRIRPWDRRVDHQPLP